MFPDNRLKSAAKLNLSSFKKKDIWKHATPGGMVEDTMGTTKTPLSPQNVRSSESNVHILRYIVRTRLLWCHNCLFPLHHTKNPQRPGLQVDETNEEMDNILQPL